MDEFFRIDSSLCLANAIRWSLMGWNPVQSCRSLMLVYLALLVTTRKAIFCKSCSFSMCTSAALMTDTAVLKYGYNQRLVKMRKDVWKE